MMPNVDLTLRDMLLRNAQRFGRKPAYVYEGRQISHADFLTMSRRIASALHTVGVRPQHRVSTLSMNSLDYALLFGACAGHGIIVATVNFRLAPAEMLHIINDAQSEVLIFESEFTDHIGQIRDRLTHIRVFIAVGGGAPDWAIDWDAFVKSGDPAGPAIPAPQPEDIAFLIYTSGTTGKSKGCMLSHRAEVATAQMIAGAMGLTPEDRLLLMMPLFHIGALALALAQQSVGGTVHLHRKFDADSTLRTIARERITATHMAPTLIQALLEAPNRSSHDVRSLRTLLYSAAAMPPSLLREALAVFGPIFQQMYGQTEGIGAVLPVGAHMPDDDVLAQQRLYSVGHAFIGCEISIRDDDNQALPSGEVGEICFRGPAIMSGYWNNSAASLAILAGGWLHTGDVGRMDEGGYVYLMDRKKDVIISGGENIYSREVEEAIIAHPAVAMAAAIGVPDVRWGEAVCAVVVCQPGHKLSAEAVIAHCRSMIAPYKAPKRVIFAEALPQLPSGKINKPELRRTYAVPVA